jgi:hypothetical protein
MAKPGNWSRGKCVNRIDDALFKLTYQISIDMADTKGDMEKNARKEQAEDLNNRP